MTLSGLKLPQMTYVVPSAVNSEGKTVEAVKGVKEPLKQGQQEATPAQRRNYRSCKKSNSKGVKV